MSNIFFKKNISAASKLIELKNSGVEFVKKKFKPSSSRSGLKSGLSKGTSQEALKKAGLEELAGDVFKGKERKEEEEEKEEKKKKKEKEKEPSP